jgi:hypothetical protein
MAGLAVVSASASHWSALLSISCARISLAEREAQQAVLAMELAERRRFAGHFQ